MELIRVQRANVILDIRPEEKEQYKEKGYSVIDAETGEVVEEALSNDVNALRTEIKSLKAELAAAKAENAKLKARKTAKAQ